MEQTYIGRCTAHYLWQVEQGMKTQESFQMWLDLNTSNRDQHCGPFNGLYHLELQETLAILRAREGSQQTPRELMALLRAYQRDIADTWQYPRRWTNAYLTPERARAWYEQQIQHIRQQLQTLASS